MSSLPFSSADAWSVLLKQKNLGAHPCVLYINVIVYVAYVTFDINWIIYETKKALRIATLAASFRVLLILFAYFYATRIVMCQQITWNICAKKYWPLQNQARRQKCFPVKMQGSLTQPASGLKRTFQPSLLRKWKNYLFFFTGKRTFEISVQKKSRKRTLFMAYFAFLLFRDFTKFHNFAVQFPKNTKICGWNWKFCFKPFSSAWACNRKGPCSNHREQSKNVHVRTCMYVCICMNRWMKECMNVKQKQLCNATKLFLIFVCFANLY